jgi:hypothetical protein
MHANFSLLPRFVQRQRRHIYILCGKSVKPDGMKNIVSQEGTTLYWLRLHRQFAVTCRFSPWEVQAEDFLKKFQELDGHHISSIYKSLCDVDSTFPSSAIVSS